VIGRGVTPPLALGRGEPAGIHQPRPRRGPGRALPNARGFQHPPAALLLLPEPTLSSRSACNAHRTVKASTDAPQLVQDVEALRRAGRTCVWMAAQWHGLRASQAGAGKVLALTH